MNVNIDTATVTVSEEMRYGGTPVLKYEIASPQLWPRTQSTERINRQNSAEREKLQKYAREEMYKVAVEDYKTAVQNEFPVREYEVFRSFTVTANESCIFSLYTDTYEYTGGAHGSTLRASQSWLFPAGRKITLSSLFPGNTHFRAALLARITAMISANPEAYFEDYKRLAAETFNPESFYLTPEGFAVYYQQYDIAPYSSGIPVFEFTYEATGATPPRCVR